MRRLDELAQFSSRNGEITRLYLTPEHRAAALKVREWMQAAGMRAEIDAVGNVIGRYDGTTLNARSVLIGSHVDTVTNGGKYDGSLGVLTGIHAVAELHAKGLRLPFAIEVLAFGDEEGVRFSRTLTGSKAVAGILEDADLDAADSAGITIRDALTRFGCDPLEIPRISRRKEDVLCYIEVHIEQGPVLESAGLPIGVITAINGATRFKVEVAGTSGHAGTVPMNVRQDALAAAAEMVLAAERLAQQTEDLVATTGCIEIRPGVVNVIAPSVGFNIDVRSSKDDVRQNTVAALQDSFQAIARRRRVAVTTEGFYDEAAVTCSSWLVKALEAAVARLNLRPYRLPSGGGHDGLAISSLCPIGMLFVRCAGGVSHNPAEAITADDADLAIRVLLEFLQHFEPDDAVSGIREA